MTDLTLLYVFGPAILISIFFLLFLRSRIYGGITKTLMMVLWVNALMVLLWVVTASPQAWVGTAQGVNEGILLAQLALSAFQSGAYVLEQLLLWGFVAFFAVIIGSIYLLITCWRKKDSSPAEKDVSLAEKMSNVSFSGTVQNPLTSGFDMMGVQAYLVIGLVTMPSMISILMGMDVAVSQGSLSLFSYSIIYYVLLFYRFSLMAYTRIAKKTDLHYGKEDLGQKYQQRMFGRFTLLNLVLSLVLLGYSLLTVPNAANYLAGGLVVELRSLLVAILILPFAEGFAAFFFMRFWHFWTRLGTRVRGINWKSASYSLLRGVLVGGACFVLFYAILSFVTAATTFFAVHSGNPAFQPVFNNEVGAVNIYGFTQNFLTLRYDELVLPTLWALVGLFLFQFIKVLIGGSLTHRRHVAPEYSIVVAAVTIAILIWVIMPAGNFLLGAFPASLATDGQTWTTLTLALVPQPLQQEFYTVYYIIPAPTVLLYILFLDFPVWILGSLLLTYFFIFRRSLIPQKKEVDVFVSSDFFKLFITFCVVVVASIGTLMAIVPDSALGQFVHSLLSTLWFPSARESLLVSIVGPAWIFFHNMIRFLLTVFAPLILWVSVVGIWKWFQREKVEGKTWYILAIVLLVVEALFFVDRFTIIAVIGIPLVLAALHRSFHRIFSGTSMKTKFRTTFLKISFYTLVLSEIYSTAIAIADRYMFPLPPPAPPASFASGGALGLLSYLLILIPHGLIEIPAIMLAGMIGLYIARRMISKIDEDEKKLSKFMDEGKKLFMSGKIWYPVLFVTVFFAVAAVLEIYVSYGPMEQLANLFGFA